MERESLKMQSKSYKDVEYCWRDQERKVGYKEAKGSRAEAMAEAKILSFMHRRRGRELHPHIH